MSVVRIFCKECGNDGSSVNGTSKGFEISVMTTTLIQMSNYNADETNVLGHEPITHPLQAVFDAHKNNAIKCRECGSMRIDVICEADLELERREQTVLDTIEIPEIVDEIVIPKEERITVPGSKKSVQKLIFPTDAVVNDDFSVGKLTIPNIGMED